MGSDLGVGYTVSLANDDLISIEFSVGSYYSGAAHPNSYTEVLNFDLKNGKVIRLSELFNPGARYLQAISNYSIGDLKKQSKDKQGMLDDDWIQRGAGPDAENYKSWTISRKGLAINFDALHGLKRSDKDGWTSASLSGVTQSRSRSCLEFLGGGRAEP